MATVIGFGGKGSRRGSRSGRPATKSREQSLAEIFSLNVIPRLLVAHSNAAAPIASAFLPEDHGAESLALIALNEAAHVLLDRVESIMARGLAAEEVFVDLLAPAARWMGREWEEDRLDFIEVSMGLWRLQEVLRHIAVNTSRTGSGADRRRALFAPMPGDQHSFGAAMVQECFTIAGWDADLMLEASAPQIIETVAGQAFDLLGLTLSCDCRAERIAGLIRGVRTVSANPEIRVMIGGPMLRDQPNLMTFVGADGTAETATQAVKVAARLVNVASMAATA